MPPKGKELHEVPCTPLGLARSDARCCVTMLLCDCAPQAQLETLKSQILVFRK